MTRIKETLKSIQIRLKGEISVYRLALKHPGTPRLAKLFLGMAVGYVLLPFDLIPDYIPIIGQLDDMILVPTLVWLGLRWIPPQILEECRNQAFLV